MNLSNPTILCVDNDDDNSEIIGVILKHSNATYKIISIKVPEEALRMAAIEKFDLYVFDYRYPHMTGIDICKTIRQTDKQTPIIFLSSEAHARECAEAMDAGANAYLVKPGGLDQLTRTVTQLLSVNTFAQAT
jgi:DNA-binding response OmpR family regulator